MRKLREEIEWKEERFTLLSDNVDKNTMADAEMEAELQGLQAGEERRGSNASQAVECCLKAMVEPIFAMGTDQAKSKFDALYQKILKRFETPTSPAQMPGMPGREEGRRDSEHEQEQGRDSQQLVSLMPGGVNQVAPASSLELDLPRVREVQEDHAREVHPDRQDGLLGMRKEMTMWEIWCRKPKRKKQPGKGPKNLSRKQTGKDPSPQKKK